MFAFLLEWLMVAAHVISSVSALPLYGSILRINSERMQLLSGQELKVLNSIANNFHYPLLVFKSHIPL